MSTTCLPLETCVEQIITGANDGAKVIYWHHGAGAFTWLRGSDQEAFRVEVKNLKRALRRGDIVNIGAGEPLQLNGKTFYPLEIEIEGSSCFAYFLIRQRGAFDDSINTPYLFMSESTRDGTIAYLNKSVKK